MAGGGWGGSPALAPLDFDPYEVLVGPQEDRCARDRGGGQGPPLDPVHHQLLQLGAGLDHGGGPLLVEEVQAAVGVDRRRREPALRRACPRSLPVALALEPVRSIRIMALAVAPE